MKFSRIKSPIVANVGISFENMPFPEFRSFFEQLKKAYPNAAVIPNDSVNNPVATGFSVSLKVVIWKQKTAVQVVAAVWYAILDSLDKELAATAFMGYTVPTARLEMLYPFHRIWEVPLDPSTDPNSVGEGLHICE